MARAKAVRYDKISSPKKSEEEPKKIFVTNVDFPVRVRTGPGISYSHTGDYLSEKREEEISEIVKGPGSKTGWGHLSRTGGWVSMDFVKVISET